MPMAGRSSKLTKQAKDTIVHAISKGTPIKYAAQAAGIHPATFFRWLEQGEQQDVGPYRDFYNAIEKAQGAAVVSHLSNIENAAQSGSWQASAWLLERRFHQDFSRKQSTELDNERQRLEIEKLKAEVARLQRDNDELDEEDDDSGMESLTQAIRESIPLLPGESNGT